MDTLRQLFENDFSDLLGITREVIVTDETTREHVVLVERVHFDFERAVAFVSYFVPYTVNTLSCCAAALSRPNTAIVQATESVDVIKRGAFSPDGIAASGLSFSREVLFYTENFLDEEELAALKDLGNDLSLVIRMRGPEYSEMRANLPKLVEKFMNSYRRSYDYYFSLARLVSDAIQDRLIKEGIRGWVTFRAKRPDSLEAKIHRRAFALDASKYYRTVDDIYSDIADLAGVRVALYFPSDREKVRRIINELFDCSYEKELQGTRVLQNQQRFSGYWATHYRVALKQDTHSGIDSRFLDAKVEIQVASLIMHAWAEVEHDLIYKPEDGTISPEEYAILDELNGIVLSGERILERLREAGERRKQTIEQWKGKANAVTVNRGHHAV